jgi:glycosyltransferase involved in cell wall biosynthesis
MIREFGLEEHVFLLGYRSDAERYLNACDAYLQTSVSEGLPVSVIEAMSHAKPVIATNVGGTAELIDEILVESGDVDTMAEKIVELVRDHKIRRELGRQNYSKYTRTFTIDRMVSAYETLYKMLVKLRD